MVGYSGEGVVGVGSLAKKFGAKVRRRATLIEQYGRLVAGLAPDNQPHYVQWVFFRTALVISPDLVAKKWAPMQEDWLLSPQ